VNVRQYEKDAPSVPLAMSAASDKANTKTSAATNMSYVIVGLLVLKNANICGNNLDEK
jgi:hypothetical protein